MKLISLIEYKLSLTLSYVGKNISKQLLNHGHFETQLHFQDLWVNKESITVYFN